MTLNKLSIATLNGLFQLRKNAAALFRSVLKREGQDAVIGNRIAEKPAAGGGDDDILFSVSRFVGHRSGFRGAGQFNRP